MGEVRADGVERGVGVWRGVWGGKGKVWVCVKKYVWVWEEVKGDVG